MHSVLVGASLFEGMSLMGGPAEASSQAMPAKAKPKGSAHSTKERAGLQGSSRVGSDALEHAFSPPVLTSQGAGEAPKAARCGFCMKL